MKYRATINIDKEIWDKFRGKCEEAGTTATAELTAFMELINDDCEYDYNRLSNDWDSLPETVKTITDFIWGKLELVTEQTISSRLEGIEKRVYDRQVKPYLNNEISELEDRLRREIYRDIQIADMKERLKDISTNYETDVSTNEIGGTNSDTNKETDVETDVSTNNSTNESVKTLA